MKDRDVIDAVTFHELSWDTEFFGVTCAKAILHKPLTTIQWKRLKEQFCNYQFISIENRNSEPANAWLIGKELTAFLADVNIQFKKKVGVVCDMPESITIYQSMERNEKILELANFPFSRFTEDPELAKRGGAGVYRQWLINSFQKTDKFFAVSEGIDGEINGYLLHSFSDKICTVELIAVSSNRTKGGIGTSLMKSVENASSQLGCTELKVGTQMRNLGAINFYQKMGYKQVECHQLYHLWNI